MKIKEQDFNGLLKTGLPPAILIYGPDNGKITDFADKIIEKLEIPADNLVMADGGNFKERFDAIFADACSASMFGGNKLVWLASPDGRDISLIQTLIESASAPVIITGDLDSKSAIRKYFEEHDKCAALPVYEDTEQELGALIRSELGKYGIKEIENDAMSYMYQHLGRDRGIARSFLGKIALYVDDKKTVKLEDAEKCLPDAGAANMDEYKFNLTAGNIGLTLRALDRLFAENIPPAMLARVLMSHFKDLTHCVAGGIMPRIFWKYGALFDTARKIWTEPELAGVLVKLSKLESDTRGAADPALLFRDFSLKLATKAYKLAMTIRKR